MLLGQIRLGDFEAGAVLFDPVDDFLERQLVMLQQQFRDLINPEMLPTHVIRQRLGERVPQVPECAALRPAASAVRDTARSVIRVRHVKPTPTKICS